MSRIDTSSTDLFLAPYNSLLNCNYLSVKTFSKTVEHIQNRLRVAFELTQLVEDFAESLTGASNIRSHVRKTSFYFRIA